MSNSIQSQQTEDIGPSADMAEETRDQQTEKIGPNADVAGETSDQQTEKICPNADMAQETSDERPRFVFDETKRHTPVFYLTEIPDGYADEMTDAILYNYTRWVAISSNSPTNAIQDIKANVAAEEEPPMPFLNSTVEEVYEFFKNHLRPADDDPNGYRHTFSYFTFLVVDADCIKSEPWQCILCCDAPDYGDPHPEHPLKQLRLPIAQAMEGLSFLEDLIKTPSEFVNKPAFDLGMIPPAWLVHVYNDQGERLGYLEFASPGRARDKKGRSVERLEEGARQQRAERSAARRKL